MAGPKRLGPDEKEMIVELKLNHVPIRQIAAQVGCAPNTVTKIWRQYLDARTAERRADLERAFEDTIARLEKNAKDARMGYRRAVKDDDNKAAVQFLAAERQALSKLADLGVVRDDAPAQAARVTAAQTGALLAVIEAAVRAANLDPAQAQKVKVEIVRELRAIEG